MESTQVPVILHTICLFLMIYYTFTDKTPLPVGKLSPVVMLCYFDMDRSFSVFAIV